MKRIAGIINFDHTPVEAVQINRMLNAMKVHDLDEQSTWIDGEVGLGGTCTGNLAGEHINLLQCVRANGPFVLTFDGRIDNRPDLLATLGPNLTTSHPPHSNEELVLVAYEKWGLEFLRYLVGDFAFAIWDSKNRRLVCARDHFGVKPFYYHLSKNGFVFASTPQALLASGQVPAVIQEERIADLLVEFWGGGLEGVDKTSSFYEDVYRLPPAYRLVVQTQGMSLQRYWELSPSLQSGWKTEADTLEAFRELFREAIRCRLQNEPTPAFMLSGGMDSSAIVGMGRSILSEAGRPPLQAFAVISNSPDTYRETAYISSVLAQGDLQPHLISETELFQRMDEVVGAIEVEAEPFDCLMNLNRALYLHARDQGVSALLDGIDGDTLLSGSGHLIQLWRQGAFRQIIGETFEAEGLTAEYKLGRHYFVSSCLSAITPIAPDWYRKLRQPHRYRKAVTAALKDSLIQRDFAIRSHLGERLAMLDSHKPRPRSGSQMEFHKIALDHPFLTVGLERYERVASAFGIEARHPYTDVRLAEFCLGLPWQWKTQHGWTKLILRHALEPLLPSEVVWRRDKDSLMWEVNRLILKERAEYFYQITLDEQANLKPYVDTAKLMKFWEAYLTRGEEEHAELIWSGIALAMWLRQQRRLVHISNESAESLIT
jgi:asparagine synthase (glutamine-hydrolysing)